MKKGLIIYSFLMVLCFKIEAKNSTNLFGSGGKTGILNLIDQYKKYQQIPTIQVSKENIQDTLNALKSIKDKVFDKIQGKKIVTPYTIYLKALRNIQLTDANNSPDIINAIIESLQNALDSFKKI